MIDNTTQHVVKMLDTILTPKIGAFQVQGEKGKNMSKYHKAAICCTAYALVKQHEAMCDPKFDSIMLIHCAIHNQYQNSSWSRELR